MVGGSGPVGVIRSGGRPNTGINQLNIAGTDYANNFQGYRTRAVGGAGTHRFTFPIPSNFTSLLTATLYGLAAGTNAAAAIDYTTEYGNFTIGELFNAHTETQAGGTESVVVNTFYNFDISGVLTGIAANDVVGLFVNHLGIGTTLHYLGVQLTYQ